MRRKLAIALLGLGALVFLAGTHLYIAQRMLEPLPEGWRAAGAAAIALLGALLVLQPVAERTLAPPWSRIVAWPASLWMGAAFWLLLLLPATDALLWLGGSAASAAQLGPPAADPAAWRVALVAGAVAVAVSAGLRSALAPPRWLRERVEIEGWPEALDGLRIVQISDLHIGPILGRDFAAEIVRRIDEREPDLIAVTGDLVDGDARRLAAEVAPLAGLRARFGVYFVTGNHDHYSGAADWVAAVEGLGMRALRNERVRIGGEAGFDLVGVDDHHAHLAGGGREDLDAALAGRDPTRPAVLLAHDPNTFARARRAGIDLQLSGHTHGGQIWPFAWFVRLATPWVAGRYRDGRAQLRVSRGTGFWGPPLRVGSPAEIGEIEIRRAR